MARRGALTAAIVLAVITGASRGLGAALDLLLGLGSVLAPGPLDHIGGRYARPLRRRLDDLDRPLRAGGPRPLFFKIP